MLPRLRRLIATLACLLLLSPSATLAGNALSMGQCPLALSATPSGDQWQIACRDGATQAAVSPKSVTFDASQLKIIRVSSAVMVVTRKPENASKPTEVVVPVRLLTLGGLVSSSLTSFTLEGAAGASVEIDTKTFTKMTALRTLSVTAANVTITNGPLELQPTLNELIIQRAGLVDFKVKIIKGVPLNLTRLDLGMNRLRHLPLAIFASRHLRSVNLVGNPLAALRLSTRKLRRFLRLVALKRVLVDAIADFTDACADGERKTIEVASRRVVVCQVPKEDDDELVVDDDDDDDDSTKAETTTASSSSSSSASFIQEAGQTATSSADAALADTTSRTVTTEIPSVAKTPSPSATSAASPAAVVSWAAQWLVVVATVRLAL